MNVLLSPVLKQIFIYIFTTAIFYLAPVQANSDSIAQPILAVGMIIVLAVVITDQLRKQEKQFFNLIALIFVAAHACAFSCFILAYQEPDQFTGLHTRTDALYFTLTTMSTVGFGDIHPVGQAAKILVMIMIIFDLVFIASLGHALSDSLRKNRTKSLKQTHHDH
ncbi:Ion channel [Corynebacterium kutscheri]|uniref:Ion channel n=1 Tax=Corynebacterium kutscheri TaxID=35755 RepID=A0A0F6TCI9_9CORY|nr:potassium channel family protein [Corynebacterium kutscheri]AKE40376.1 Ion channel [Corynebacterium kutscheri]VEH10771.1 transport protein of the voltage-gated ion channel superfamily [Corynebacterium kutscheri]